MKTKLIILLLTMVFLGISVINPIYPKEMYLQHSATILAFIFMFIDLKKNYLSLFAFCFFTAFILLHIIGARYIYSFVPYQEWFDGIINFDSERNHYDRLVHFSFGVLFFPAIFELIESRISRWKISLLVSWLFIQTFSMFYELFEWGLTLMVSSKMAESYNGQQGDQWDAHKDMLLAMIGSTLIMLIYIYRNSRLKKI